MNFEGNKGPTLDSAQSLRLIGETITMTTLLELLGHALGALTRLVLCVKSWKRDLSLTMCRPLSACCVVSQLWALVLVNEGKNTKKTKITKHTDPNHIMWELTLPCASNTLVTRSHTSNSRNSVRWLLPTSHSVPQFRRFCLVFLKRYASLKGQSRWDFCGGSSNFSQTSIYEQFLKELTSSYWYATVYGS